MDILLAGPGGIWCLEVKAYTSRIRNVGDQWQYRSRLFWQNLGKHPGKQARRMASQVKEYLENNHLPVRWVQPIIVWAGDESKLTVEDPAVPVWTISNLESHLEDLWRQTRLAEENIQPIVTFLETAIEKVKSKK